MLEVRNGSSRQVLPLLSQDESLVSWLLDDVVDSIEMDGPPGRICTRTGSLLRRVSLLLDYKGMKGWSLWPDSHRHGTAFEAVASAIGLHREGTKVMALPAGLAPATSAFEARRSVC